MSTLAERIGDQFTTLETLVSNAEKAKDESKAVQSFVGKVRGVLNFVEGLNGDDAAQIVQAMNGQAEVWPGTVETLASIVDHLSKASGLDRSEGDACVTQLRAVMTLGWENAGLDDETEKAEALIARWEATRPASGSKGTGENGGKNLGFTVQSKCACGFTRSTSKDNLNSHRYQLQEHEKTAHKHLDVARGTDWHKNVTKALTDLMDGTINRFEVPDGNGWTFEKVDRV